MIENPIYISRSGTECNIALGVDVSHFDGDSNIGLQVASERLYAVRWMICEKNIRYYPVESGINAISAYPTPDMQKMVIVKFGKNSGSPTNAIILNDRAEVIFTPQLPKRISKEKWLPKGDLYFFIQSGWCDHQDHIFFYLSIDNTDWVETRYFNYKTMTWNEERYETWRS